MPGPVLGIRFRDEGPVPDQGSPVPWADGPAVAAMGCAVTQPDAHWAVALN